MTGDRHATSAELELWVLGGLDPERAAVVEQHCASCDACARALAGEASLEVAFEQVARRAEHAPAVVRPVRAAAYGAAGLVAMAAAVLLWFGRAAATPATGEGTAAAAHHTMQDGAILDAKNDALDGG
jgi:anti-sigma factor RsiW